MAQKGSHGIHRNRPGVGFWRRILASAWYGGWKRGDGDSARRGGRWRRQETPR
jgi:hypothetical protein